MLSRNVKRWLPGLGIREHSEVGSRLQPQVIRLTRMVYWEGLKYCSA